MALRRSRVRISLGPPIKALVLSAFSILLISQSTPTGSPGRIYFEPSLGGRWHTKGVTDEGK